MADNGAPEDQSNEPTSAQEFPHKMRVHALARILGITSREVLAFLAELGVAARSPQSSIDRSAAVQVRDRAAAPEGDAVAPPAEGDTPTDSVPATEKAAPSAFEQTPSLFSAAATAEPVAPAADAPPSESATDAAQTPLFLQPQAPERPARTRRAERPSAEATAEKNSTDTPPRETPAADGDTASTTADDAEATDGDRAASDDRSDTDGEGGANRRRRRGRRGRGRGRGDQSGDEQNSDEQSGSDDATSGPSGDGDAGDAATGDDAEQAPDATDADTTDGDASETTGSRGSGRSRNARRSSGKGSGDGANATDDETPDGSSSDGSASSADDDSDSDADDSDDDAGSGTRRRRRRRRRKGGADGSDGAADGSTNDDPPNTVVHEREPRNKSRSRDRDEVQGISGSTRLEAKRQRRRDGRDAGRRRPPILTESEFLARREAVDRVMVVRERSANTRLNDDTGETTATEDYTQVAVLEDGVLVEHFVTTSTSSSMVGNIFLGRVQNVLPGMEAAFVDIGRGRNGVLYAGEVNWDAAGLDGGSRKIEQALKPGDPVVVQVSKDPVGHKGARLTTQISLAGRYLVYVPGGSSTGISRKLPDTERKRLKSILSKLIPSDAGVIIRTASEGVSAEELAADIDRLKNQWAQIEKVTAEAGGGKGGKNGSKGSAPQALYSEPDLLVKVVRDLFNEDFTSLIVDGNSAWDQVHGYVEAVAPDLMERLERFEKAHADAPDAFVVHRIDEQLAKALERKVWLPSGGTLIIEHTEAMTVVDVNTGKFTGSGGNLEETVTRNNLEAAEEIVRQMRLRDIGGMIIVDFIDMVLESNRDLVLRRLTEALSRDRTRHQVSEVTSLGLVQMTRKRLGTGLLEAFSSTCTCCNGRGIVVHADPVEVQSGDDAPRQDGSKRSRRGGKRKSEPSTESKPAHSPAEHPMFRAMASHGDETADGAGAETTTDDTAQVATADATAVEVVVETGTDTEVAVVEVTGPAEVDASPEVADDVAAASETDAPETPASETPPSADAAPEAAAPKRRRRAARRPAAAPAGGGEAVAGTAETLAATVAVTTPVTTITAATSEEPTVAVRTRPRRRAAGRPAGPPVDE
ncbi:translation initiation factor IF-2 N-terminal domain-containing protein [Williamsia sp. MIQD14]|uniref:translation initiation factor IF-2 N-terminal domain-containing protein n=1 Tax=Williamsia sp. MIQD14 TaxID=3425703 RepID=UPI003DA04D22